MQNPLVIHNHHGALGQPVAQGMFRVSQQSQQQWDIIIKVFDLFGCEMREHSSIVVIIPISRQRWDPACLGDIILYIVHIAEVGRIELKHGAVRDALDSLVSALEA